MQTQPISRICKLTTPIASKEKAKYAAKWKTTLKSKIVSYNN